MRWATGNFRAAVNCRSLVPFQNFSLSFPCSPPVCLSPRAACHHHSGRSTARTTNARSRANFRAWLACRESRHGPPEIFARRGATDKLNRPRPSAGGHRVEMPEPLLGSILRLVFAKTSTDNGSPRGSPRFHATKKTMRPLTDLSNTHASP